MSFKTILTPYKDPMEGPDWDEQTDTIIEKIEKTLKDYQLGIDYKLSSSTEGIGADFPIIVLEILALGSTAFYGIPKLYKQIKDSLQGWRDIWDDINKFCEWLGNKEPIVRYSIEVAFLKTLQELSKEFDVDELETIEAKELLGLSGFIEPSFENTSILYYLFIFRNNGSSLLFVVVDSTLKLCLIKSLPINPFDLYK